MTLFEALMPHGRAKSGEYVVIRQGWINQTASGDYYKVFRNGYRMGTYKTLLDVLRAVQVDTMSWEVA